MRTLFTSVLALAAVLLAVLPAAACPKPVHHHHPRPVYPRLAYPNVFLDDEHGVLTTPCDVYPGETLHGVGLVTGTFTILSVTPDGPVYRVTLSPAPVPPQSSEVLDFRS